MTNFLNLETGLPEQLAPGDAEKAYLGGTHGIDQTQPAYVVDPRDNMTYEITADQAPDYIKAGFRFEQPKEASNRYFREDVQKHPIQSGIGEVASEVANQMTLGAFDASGAIPKEQREILQEEHPYLNWMGKLSGFGLSVAGGGPIWDGVGYAGDTGASLVQKGMTVFGKGAADSLVGKAAQAVARNAAEGAAVALPTGLTETVLGDHDGIGESLMAGVHRVEEGAVIGAALTPLAGALKLAGKQLSPEVLDNESRYFQLKGFGNLRTKDFQNLQENIQPEISAARAAAEAAGNADEAARFVKPTRETLYDETGKLFDKHGFSRDLSDVMNTPEGVSDKIREKLVDVGERMNSVRETADQTLPGAITPGNLLAIGTGKFDTLANKYNSTFGKSATSSYQDINTMRDMVREGFATAAQKNGSASMRMGFDDFYELQQQQLKKFTFPNGGFGIDAARSPGAFDAYNTATQHADEYLNAVMKNNPQVFTDTMRDLKDNYGQLLRMQKIVEPGANRSVANNRLSLSDYILGGVGGLIGHGTIGVLGGAAMNALRRKYGNQLMASGLWKASQAVDAVQEAVTSVLGQGAVNNIARNIQPASTGVLLQLANPGGEKPKNDIDAYHQFTDKINKLSTDPNHAAEIYGHLTSGMDSRLAMTQQATQQNMATAVAYLKSQMPVPPNTAGPFGGPEWTPSDRERASFERKVAAVNAPLSILTDFKNGVLSRDSVDAVRTVYPKLFGYIQQKAGEYATANPGLPYGVKSKLALLVGAQTRPQTSPAKIQQLQQGFVTDNKPKPRANSKITEAARSGTEVGRVSYGQ